MQLASREMWTRPKRYLSRAQICKLCVPTGGLRYTVSRDPLAPNLVTPLHSIPIFICLPVILVEYFEFTTWTLLSCNQVLLMPVNLRAPCFWLKKILIWRQKTSWAKRHYT